MANAGRQGALTTGSGILVVDANTPSQNHLVCCPAAYAIARTGGKAEHGNKDGRRENIPRKGFNGCEASHNDRSIKTA
jgi:hypothetical protein